MDFEDHLMKKFDPLLLPRILFVFRQIMNLSIYKKKAKAFNCLKNKHCSKEWVILWVLFKRLGFIGSTKILVFEK